MIDVGQYSCGDLFGIETVNTPEIPLMNLRFVKKHHFEDDKGYGIYFFRFNDELLYAGSYCGSSGVAKDRWWTHLASITCRFQETNFTNLNSKKDPKLQDLLADCNREQIHELLERSKTNFREVYIEVFDNKDFFDDVASKLLSITPTSSKQTLQHLLGNGSCSTFQRRVKVANDRWDQFKKLSASDIATKFSFQYIRIREGQYQNPLFQFLQSTTEPTKNKRRLVQSFIEDRVIENLKPPANKLKKPIDGTGFQESVIESALYFVDECIALGKKF